MSQMWGCLITHVCPSILNGKNLNRLNIAQKLFNPVKFFHIDLLDTQYSSDMAVGIVSLRLRDTQTVVIWLLVLYH